MAPEYAFAWVENATPSEANEGIARLAADEIFLHGLDEAGQRRFLRDWYFHGNLDALTGFLNGRTDWRSSAWPVQLRQLADAGRYEQAVREGVEHYGISLALPEPDLPRDVAPPPVDQEASDPAAAFTTYWKAGNDGSARRVLDKLPDNAPGPLLAELWRLKIALAVHDADWPAAWRDLAQEIALTHPAETL